MRGVSLLPTLIPLRRVAYSWRIVLRDAAFVVTSCIAAASMVNILRGDGVPFVQSEEYQILVPCPETQGEAEAVPPTSSQLQDPRVLMIDAREAEAFTKWHVPRAINVPFDYLSPVEREITRRVASSGAREVVVYGDSRDPDSGEQLARELSGHGIRNVRFVRGGATAITALMHQGATP